MYIYICVYVCGRHSGAVFKGVRERIKGRRGGVRRTEHASEHRTGGDKDRFLTETRSENPSER